MSCPAAILASEQAVPGLMHVLIAVVSTQWVTLDMAGKLWQARSDLQERRARL